MATKKPKQATATRRTGRPAKSDGVAATSQVNLRLVPSDRAILDAIQVQEQERYDSLNVAAQVSPADALRIILRAEGKRRGLVGAPAEE